MAASYHGTAYSYIRFSSKKQGGGRSIRRQEELRDAWVKKMGVALDTTLKADKGVSSFKGKHRSDRHALAAFLKLVEEGKVPKGSYLIVESLDRLTREHIQPALLLVLNLLQAGVRVVQLQPVEMVFDDKSDTLPVMMMMVELSRGHSESAMKSERKLDSWRAAREAARGLVPFHAGRDAPAWLRAEGGRLILVPEKAAAVLRVFELAAAGYGQYATVRKLNEEGVPPIADPVHKLDDDGQPTAALAKGARWTRTYVAKLLSDRRVLGECQLRSGGKDEGEPIVGYFPAVVDEGLFARAQAACRGRTGKGGRPSGRVHIFQGLLYDARDGGRLHVANGGGNRTEPVLRPYSNIEGLTSYASFPLDAFEEGILTCLAEVEPEEVLAEDDAEALRAEMARVDASIAATMAELDEKGESPALFQRVREKEERKRQLAEELRRPRSTPADYDRSAFALTDGEEDRRRLRTAVQRVVESIHCLFVAGVRRRKLAVVQVFFKGSGISRWYLLCYTPATRHSGSELEVLDSLLLDTSSFDFRTGRGVKELAEMMGTYPQH
jgi:DNA invertase Pin-like site-specific DNA recombinase